MRQRAGHRWRSALAGHAVAAGEWEFSLDPLGLTPAPCNFALAFAPYSFDSNASGTAQPSNANSPDAPPIEDRKQRLKVNPETGLAGASEANYSPLTGSERWKLYFKMNYWSVGAYFGPFLQPWCSTKPPALPINGEAGFRDSAAG